MPKKQTTIKRSNGNISITIENNLKATQVAPKPEKRKRRRRKPTTATNENIDELLRGGGGRESLPPLKDVSYIKPPGNSFNVWRDTIDSFNTSIPIGQAQQMGLIMAPPPPAPALLPPPPSNNTFNIGNSDTNRSLYDSPSWRDFSMFMAGMTPNRGRPPRGLVNMFDYDDDDDDEYIPSSLQFAQPPQAPPPGQAETVEQDIIPDNVINSIPGITEEQVAGIQNNNRIATAKREGTKHGKRGIPKQGEYREMDEYIINYEKALNTFNIENDRQKKLEEVRKNKMYELGKKHAKEGGTLKYNRNARNVDFKRGYDEYLDSLEAGAPAAGS
jgi:hypothetical protein